MGEVQDPAEYLAHSRGATFLFQCPKQDYRGDDERYTRKRLAALYAVVPEPKIFRWVPGSHGELYENPKGAPARFQLAWLLKNLH